MHHNLVEHADDVNKLRPVTSSDFLGGFRRKFPLAVCYKTIGSCLRVRIWSYDALGKFGEHSRSGS